MLSQRHWLTISAISVSQSRVVVTHVTCWVVTKMFGELLPKYDHVPFLKLIPTSPAQGIRSLQLSWCCWQCTFLPHSKVGLTNFTNFSCFLHGINIIFQTKSSAKFRPLSATGCFDSCCNKSGPFLRLSLHLTFILCLHGKVQLQQLTIKPFPHEEYFKEAAYYYILLNEKNKRWTDG